MTNVTRLDPDTLPAFPRDLDRYRGLVEEIEEGYTWNIYEYTNDLSCRQALQAELDGGLVLPAEYQEELRILDDRLKRPLVPTRESIHGNPPPAHFWFHGVPSTAPEVLEDARAHGWLAAGSSEEPEES